MGRYANMFTNGNNRISGRVLLLAATSSLSLTLAACSQPSATAAESAPATEPAVVATQTAQSPAEPNIVATQTTQPASAAASTAQIDEPPVKTSPVRAPVTPEQSTLLQKVSATVYKDPNCSCCKDWVSYTEDYGMSATIQHPKDLSLFKDRYGVPQEMRSCHTAVTTNGYVFEGHVPAKYMAQFLANPSSNAIGLAVPGMRVGSPGMESQGKFLPYQIMQLNKDGTTEVYADIESPEQQI